MRTFLQICAVFHERKQKLAELQYSLLHPDASDDELSKDRTQDISQILSDALINGKCALAYVKHKHHEILKIEHDVQEIQILMYAMAALVEAQSSFVDEIYDNVEYSKQHIKEGKTSLGK